MNLNEIREKVSNNQIIYILLIYFLVAKKYLHLIYNNILYKPSPLVTMTVLLFGVFLALNLVISRFTRSEIVLLVGGIITFLICKEQLLLIYIIMAIAAKKIEDGKIIKYYLIFNLLFLLLVVIGNWIGLIPDSINLHYRIVDGVQKIRHDFGFGNPNAMFFYLMPIYTGYIYFKYEKYNWVDRIVLWSIATFVYFTTYSRTGFAVVILGLIMVEIFKYTNIMNLKGIKVLIRNTPLIFLGGSVFIGLVFAASPKLNALLSARPEYWNVYLKNAGLFGKVLNFEVFHRYPLDNSYIYLVGLYGIIVATGFILIANYSLNKLIEEQNYKLIISLIMFFIYGFGEDILFSTSINWTLIIMLKNINLNEVFNYYKTKLISV